MILLWILIAFLAGALPFSLWLGRLALGIDIRDYGDGNPGATNVLRAGGFYWFSVALLLDVLKGALPVALAFFVAGYRGPGMVAIAVAPALGHAFSPFLGGRGGKAIAAIFGGWIGLTTFAVPVIALLCLALWLAVVRVHGWAVILTALSLLAYLLRFLPDPVYLGAWAGFFLLLLWTHQADLRRPPGIRPWLRRLYGQGNGAGMDGARPDGGVA